MLLRTLLGLLLLAHGVAHLVGFVVPWRVATLAEMPYRTSVLGGRLDVGATGIRLVGLLWLVAALAFVVVAGAVILRTAWWYPALRLTVGFSLALCVVGWPDSRLGFIANALALGLAFLNRRPGALPWS